MNDALESLFDLLLCAALLGLAWRSVAAPEPLRRIATFLIFGLLMAIVWARLGAPDLALAEAALGAGVTSALLLGAGVSSARDGREPARGTKLHPARALPRPLLVVLCAFVGVGLALLMHASITSPAIAPSTVEIDAHALGNPVTAVLLDFRGYDTVLELVVLLLAFLGMRVLSDRLEQAPIPSTPTSRAPMLDQLLAMSTPVLLLTALYVLWAGADAPGGAFQSGALLAGLGVMYCLAGRLQPREDTPALMRVLLVLGVGAFALFACASLIWAQAPLTFPSRGVRAIALALDLALMTSVAFTLLLLFLAAPGAHIRRH